MSDLDLSFRDDTGLDVLIAVEQAVPLGFAAGLAQDFRNPPAFVPLELIPPPGRLGKFAQRGEHGADQR